MFTIYGKMNVLLFQGKAVLDLLGKEYEYKELDKDYTEEEFESSSRYYLTSSGFDGKNLGNANET